MPDVHIYLPTDMFLKLEKAGDKSKTIQEALVLLWKTRDKKKNK